MIEISDGIERHFFVGDNIERDRNIYRTRPSYVKVYKIKNEGTTDLTDYQVKIEDDFSGDAGVLDEVFTQLYYWKESSNIVWIKVPSIPASGEATVYMYYGNPSATSESNANETFDFYDDFEGTSLDTSKWSIIHGSVDISNSILTLIPTSTYRTMIASIQNFDGSYEIKMRGHPLTDDQLRIGIGSTTQDPDIFYNPTEHLSIWEEASVRKTMNDDTLHIIISGISVDKSIFHIYTLRILKGEKVERELDDANFAEASETFYPSEKKLIVWIRENNMGNGSEVDWIRVRKYTDPEPTVVYQGDVSIL